MAWLNIVELSLLALPITLAAVCGLFRTKAIELVAWLLLGLGVAWSLSASMQPFFSAFTCGALMGIWQHLLSIALWKTYAAKNPKVAEQISTAATEKKLSPQAFMLASAPMVGIIYGVVLGLLAFGASKLPSH